MEAGKIDCTNVSLHIKISATKFNIERRGQETGKLSNNKHDRKSEEKCPNCKQ